MNQNWIVENLNNAFFTWNGKLSELWGLVTTSPEHFKGGAVWAIMQTLHNAMVGIGYALIVLFFAIFLFKKGQKLFASGIVAQWPQAFTTTT